jgi:hypothetical protein
MKGNIGKVSLVWVVSDDHHGLSLVRQVDEMLVSMVDEHEVVIVANGIGDALAQLWSEKIHEIPDATLHFLPQAIEPDTALLVAMDNAIGDWILMLAEEDAAEENIGHLLAEAEKGASHVVLDKVPTPVTTLHFYDLARRSFFILYRILSRLDVDADAPRTRLFSRAAVLWLLSQRNGDLILRCRSLVSGFPTRRVMRTAVAHTASGAPPHRSAGQGFSKALAAFLRTGGVPLRLMTLFSLLTAILSVVYAILVLYSYVAVSDIVRGWTQLSLHISAMFFVFSLMFVLMGEYLIQIDAAISYRLKYTIVREIRSRLSRTLGRINVQEG